jgi:Uma2 family endonuclease
MASHTRNLTAEELATFRDDGGRYELVRGELRMMSPAGGRHGRVAHNLSLALGLHVRKAGLGAVYAAETGFLLARAPDTVRAPDIAFIAASRLAEIEDETGFVPITPDLVGEVISPTDSFSGVEEKALAWLDAGARLVLLVDPVTRTLHAYRAADNIVVLEHPSELDVSDVVDGWTLRTDELFVD